MEDNTIVEIRDILKHKRKIGEYKDGSSYYKKLTPEYIKDNFGHPVDDVHFISAICIKPELNSWVDIYLYEYEDVDYIALLFSEPEEYLFMNSTVMYFLYYRHLFKGYGYENVIMVLIDKNLIKIDYSKV
jgi:hypothetical protein